MAGAQGGDGAAAKDAQPPRMRRLPSSEASMDKVKERLEAYFAGGQFYEAQQLYHTLYNRLAPQGKFSEAAELLATGAAKLLQHGQGNAGGELAKKLVDCYAEAKQPATEAMIDTLLSLFAAFPADAKESRVIFMRAAVRWSEKASPFPKGHPRLHHALAVFLSSVNDDGEAQRHWLRCERPEEHAQQLLAWSRRCFRGELDLVVVRAVLQYCALENLRDANAVFRAFCAAANSESLDTPLMNFARFLLQTLERDALPLFQMLRIKYAASIARDPSFEAYLARISELFYKTQPPKGMLDELMRMME